MYEVTIWNSPAQRANTCSISVIENPQNGGQKQGVIICVDMQIKNAQSQYDFYKRMDARTTLDDKSNILTGGL